MKTPQPVATGLEQKSASNEATSNLASGLAPVNSTANTVNTVAATINHEAELTSGQEPMSSCGGWFRAMRSPEAEELWCRHRPSFYLAYIIAKRARWSNGFNEHNLQAGEALIGVGRLCLKRREYRTAVNNLEKYGFATFKRTNRGTIARLTDSRLFQVGSTGNGKPADQQQANSRPTTGQQQATNKKDKNDQNEKREEASAPVSGNKPRTQADQITLDHKIANLEILISGLEAQRDKINIPDRNLYPTEFERAKAKRQPLVEKIEQRKQQLRDLRVQQVDG